ncbi:MAG TPA: hypothetical protein VHX63_11940 [Acidobacteriaceae bacterium]|nr:hypothetical protein [Acidobacteriaceae bacterium]
MPRFSPLHTATAATFVLSLPLLAQTQRPAPAASTRKASEQSASFVQADDPNNHAPLPDAAVVKQRVLDNLKKTEAEQERYICRIAREEDSTDKNGRVKKGEIKDYDMFYVNGREIDELISKNGKILDAGQQTKEADRVKKEIEKDSDEKHLAKEQADDEKQLDLVLHALRYTNGHRQIVNGRSTLIYDLSGDPSFHPKNVQETFVHNMTGIIQIDETTGELVDLNAHLDHDVKIGGGLLANIHKGFWIHIHQVRRSDGVWIPDLAEGKGDARAALFLHPYFQFKQTTSSCHLTNVTTQTGEGTVAGQAGSNVKIN